MSMTNSDKGAGRNRKTFTDLVRGYGSKRPKTVKEDFPRLIRLVRLSRQPPPSGDDPLSPGGDPLSVISHDASEESAALGPEPGSGEVPFGDLRASKKVFHQAVAIAEEIRQSVRARTSLSGTNIETALAALLEGLQTSDALLLPFFSPGGGSANPAQKAVSVCILSLKIGMELNYAPDALRKLGLAALRHEAGVGRTQKDGSGHTSGIRDKEIQEHAHVVELASLFESLVGRRPVQSGFWPSEAIKQILQRERGTFPDRILKALIRIMATFPVGCLVRLNTGETCRVVAKNDRFLLRPMVVVLVRRGKRLPEPTPIDLSQNPFLHIQGFVTEEMLDQEVDGVES